MSARPYLNYTSFDLDWVNLALRYELFLGRLCFKNQRSPAEQGSGPFEEPFSYPRLCWWSLIDIVWQYAISAGQSPETARRSLFILKFLDPIQGDPTDVGQDFFKYQGCGVSAHPQQ